MQKGDELGKYRHCPLQRAVLPSDTWTFAVTKRPRDDSMYKTVKGRSCVTPPNQTPGSASI